MNTSAKTLLSFGSIIGAVGVPVATYDQLVWKKTREENKKFEKVFEDRKRLVLELGIEGLDPLESSSSAAPKINKWCEDSLNNNSDSSTNYFFIELCENKFSKVKDFLSAWNNFEFITSDEDYDTILFTIKRGKLSEHEFDLTTITTTSELKNWCKDQLDKKISDVNRNILRSVDSFCKVPVLRTIREIIENNFLNWKIVSSGWEDIFEKWKNTDSLIELLKKNDPIKNSNLSKSTDKVEGGSKLKEWCESNLDKRLTGSTEIQFLDHINFACSGKTPEDIKQAQS